MSRPLILTAIAALAAMPLESQTPALTPHQQLARGVYRQLVEINTADSVGSVTKAARAMADRFLASGFPARDVRVLIPPGKPTKGNLVVRYHGRPGSTMKPILLLAHLDVVAANRSDWPRDPFTLHEENGFFLGRGTADDKAMASIFVANLLRMKKDGYVPDRDIIIALTSDEESGPFNGVDWLVTNHRNLVDAGIVINEGGDGTLRDGKPVANYIELAQKITTNYTLRVTNRGGHSSVPRTDNAITSLADALAKVISSNR